MLRFDEVNKNIHHTIFYIFYNFFYFLSIHFLNHHELIYFLFYLPHRNEPRGIGGIFFDYETKDWIKNFKFVRELGLAFIDISNKVIKRKKKLKYSKKDKKKQLLKRGRYVEFNLLYDRGTKFGLNSGGNTDSILMSLPPEVKWK